MGLFRAFIAKLTPAPRGRVEIVNGVAMTDGDMDPDISYVGHIVLSMIFFLTTVAYTVFALIAFFTRPESETFSQLPASQFDPVPLHLQISCANAPYCGAITVGNNYTGVRDCEAMLGVNTTTYPASLDGAGTVTLGRTLCYSEQSVYSVDTTQYFPTTGLQIDFAAINPGINKSTTPETSEPSMKASAAVRVTSPEVDGGFKRLVNMDTWQVKTLVLGMNVKRRDGVVVSRSLFPMAIQYEGKRPNWRATLFVSLAPLANVYDTDRPGTLLETIASIGGATSMITAALIVITPIVGLLLPGETKDAETIEGAVIGGGSGNHTPKQLSDTEPISVEVTPRDMAAPTAGSP